MSLQDTRAVLLEYQKFHDLHGHQSVLSLISDDLEEISGCLSAEAYKSSCIMAGSVLETFLTDWLSEILGDPSLKHVDDMPSVLINTTPSAPLTKPLLAKPKNNKSWSKLNAGIQSVRCYHQQKALEWSQFEKMAGFIRDARNSVHGNAHSKSVGEGAIESEKCQNVLDNLKAIIHSRYWSVEEIENAQLPKERSAELERLIKAIQEENVELFNSMALDEEIVNLEDGQHRTLCFYAAEAQSFDFLTSILDAGADIERVDPSGATPLFYAAKNSNSNASKLLLMKGADVNHVDGFGRTAFWYAAGNPNIEVLKNFIGADVEIDREDKGGKTPLFTAVNNANPEAVRLLLSAGANVEHVTIRDIQNNVTPLFIAARNSNPEVIKVLLEAGANVNYVDPYGETSLFEAARNSNVEVMKLFLNSGLDVNRENIFGRTPLFFAAGNSNPEVIKVLLDAGANVNHVDSYGETALFEAAKKSNIEVMKLLLSCDNVHMSSQNRKS